MLVHDVSVSDSDGEQYLRISVWAEKGRVGLPQAAELLLEVEEGMSEDMEGDGSFVVVGNETALNLALAGLVYYPPADWTSYKQVKKRLNTDTVRQHITPMILNELIRFVQLLVLDLTAAPQNRHPICFVTVYEQSNQRCLYVWKCFQADAIHLSAEDPSGLSSHVRLVVLVAAGRNDPPQVHVPGATYNDEPCDSRDGKIGVLPPQHPAPLVRQCRRITTVDRIQSFEDTTIALKGVYIEDSDIDEAGPGAQIDVEVEAQHGSFGFAEGPASPPGIFLVPSEDSEPGKHRLSMRGALSFINAALAKLTYTPKLDWSGSDEVVIRANDRGFTGSGGAGTDTRGIPVNVAPRNDPPLILVTAAGSGGAGSTAPPPPVEVREDARVTLHNFTLYDADVNPRELHRQILGFSSDASFSDYPADANGGQFEVTVTVEHGRVFFPRTAGLAFVPAAAEIDGEMDATLQAMAPFTQGARFSSSAVGTSTLATNEAAGPGPVMVSWWREARFTGRLHEINRAIAAMTYWPDVNWSGVDRVHVSVVESQIDVNRGGSDETERLSPLQAVGSVYVHVHAVNDAPVVTPPSPLWHHGRRTGDLLSPTSAYGTRVFVAEDNELLLPGFDIRDVDVTDDGGENAYITTTVTCHYGKASITWHGTRAGVGPGDSRHPQEENSLGVDLTGLLFRDDATGEWAPWAGGMGEGVDRFTFRSKLTDAVAVLQSLAFRPTDNFFGSGAWVRVEAFDEGLSGRSTLALEGSPYDLTPSANTISARGVATVPITVLAVNDAPSIQLPFSEDGQVILRLQEGEDRRLDGARWRGSFAAAVQASAHYPLRKGMELWRSQGVFPGKDAGRWGLGQEMEWKEALVVDINEGLGDGSPRHFTVLGGYLYFQVRCEGSCGEKRVHVKRTSSSNRVGVRLQRDYG